MPRNPNLDSFLEELTALTRKYNLIVGACGCCSSPWISEPLIGEASTSDPEAKYFIDDNGAELAWRKTK